MYLQQLQQHELWAAKYATVKALRDHTYTWAALLLDTIPVVTKETTTESSYSKNVIMEVSHYTQIYLKTFVESVSTSTTTSDK